MHKSDKSRITANVVEDDYGCWIWVRRLDRKGYGKMTVRKSTVAAHRFSYETFIGPIPEGMQVDHTCGFPDCVNPAHLEAVTPQENRRRQAGTVRRLREEVRELRKELAALK